MSEIVINHFGKRYTFPVNPSSSYKPVISSLFSTFGISNEYYLSGYLDCNTNIGPGEYHTEKKVIDVNVEWHLFINESHNAKTGLQCRCGSRRWRVKGFDSYSSLYHEPMEKALKNATGGTVHAMCFKCGSQNGLYNRGPEDWIARKFKLVEMDI